MKINKKRIIKTIRNIIISFVVLLILAVGGGVGYIWYMGQQDNSASLSSEPEPVKPKTESIKPAKEAANAKASASIQSITSPVNPGLNASVYVKTNVNAACKISVVYNKIASTDSGLKDKTADEYGIVSWTWTVEKTVPVGKWPVTVTCGLDEKRYAVAVGDLVVELPAKN